MWLRFTGTSGARHVSVIRPGYTPAQAQSQRFTNRFLAALSALHPGVIRGMDFLRTNGSPQTNWTDRPTICPTYYTPAGAPLEDLIGLCNRTGADLWLNIPESATPAYVSSEAALVARQLNPGSYVYLEISNEVWNTAAAFKPQHDTNVSAAAAAATACGFSGNAEQMGWQRTAWLCSYDGSIFRSAIGERARPVLAGQGGNLATLQAGLAWLSARNLTGTIYGTAIAPYSALVPTLAPASWQANPQTWAAVQKHAAIARQYGLAPCFYECGVDLSGAPSAANLATQKLPAMGPLINQYLLGCASPAATAGPYLYYDLASYWSSNGGAVYGLTDDASNLREPKFAAAAAFSASH